MDFSRNTIISSTDMNHECTLAHPDLVSRYIGKEIKYGALHDPFSELPFPCHIPPRLTRDKPNFTDTRVILNLNFPKGQSINDMVPTDEYIKFLL